MGATGLNVAPPRICMLVSTLARPGGAERVVAFLANAWTRSGVAVSIVTTDSPELPPFFELESGVDVRNLNVAGTSRNVVQAVVRNVRQIARIRRAVRQISPDVVISFIDVLNVSAVFACVGTGIPVIAAERTSPAHAPIGPIWTFLRNVAYRMADRVVVQSGGAHAYFQEMLGERLAIIPNPVPQTATHRESVSRSSVVAIGRFTEEKGFDLLIRSFAAVAGEFPDWTLTIFGDGPLRPPLEGLVHGQRLDARVFLPGITNNSGAVLAAADIFVLSSYFEGFPNALCEAMAAGVACIATDCPDGPREIVHDAIDGILVPAGDCDALAAALRQLMQSASDRQRLGAAAREAMGRFSIAPIIGRWNALIDEVRRTQAGR